MSVMSYEEYLDEVTTLLTEMFDMSEEGAIKLVMRVQANDFFTKHDDIPAMRTLERAQQDAKTIFEMKTRQAQQAKAVGDRATNEANMAKAKAASSARGAASGAKPAIKTAKKPSTEASAAPTNPWANGLAKAKQKD